TNHVEFSGAASLRFVKRGGLDGRPSIVAAWVGREVAGGRHPVLQDRNYRGLPGIGNWASRRRINSTALSIASRNAFSLAGDGRRSSPANRRTKNIPA